MDAKGRRVRLGAAVNYGSAVRARLFLRRGLVVLSLLSAVAAVALGGYFGGKELFGTSGGGAPPAPAPRIVLHKAKEQSAADLGFPAFATRNTTRVGGVDPVDDAAGAALAAYPSSGNVPGPAAVSLVSADSWQNGVAAASLAAPPIGAPVLLGGSDSVPTVTTEALGQLAPRGAKETGGAQLLAIGSVLAPKGLETTAVKGSDPAKLAASIARLRARLAGAKPQRIVVASSSEPA